MFQENGSLQYLKWRRAWKISVMRLQVVKEMAVTLKMLVKQKLVPFQIDYGASVNILLLKYAGGEELVPCLQTLVMCNCTKVKPLGTCALKVLNPRKKKKVQGQIFYC